MIKEIPPYRVDTTWVKNKTEDRVEYDLSDPAMRRLYFNSKVGEEIEKLKNFLKRDSFIAYLLAPKMAGKGTYTAMLREILGEDLIEHISVGDIVRKNHQEFEKKGKKSEIYKYAQENYRGFLSLEEVFKSLINRDTKSVSVPTEFVLTLIKKEIDSLPNKTIFLDGFPRKADQLSYTLYLRELINHREDKDLFVLINLPIEVINQRITGRTICPECQTSRNLKLNPTMNVCYDEKCSEYYLVCDNPSCGDLRMVCKEGDELGIENIKDRIIDDLQLMEQARKIHGVDNIEIYNALEKENSLNYVDEYELTKEFCFNHNDDKKVSKETKPFSILDNGVEYVSLLPASALTQLIKQIVFKLGL
jgi:adenylate kinase family enzyme